MVPQILIALSLLFPACGVSAQDLEKDVQRPSRDEALTQRAEKVAAEAAKRDTPGEDVTWEQVMARPDDIQLNYSYAKAQVRRGDVKGAASTLERILMVAPNQHEVRLFYAVVLYRLDNMAEAQRELDSLKTLPLPGALRAEADRYLAAVQKRGKRTLLSGSLNLGFEYDTNRNAAPSAGRSLFGDNDVMLTGTSQRRDDTSLNLIGTVGARHQLAGQAGHQVFGNLTYYQAEQTLRKSLNLKAYSVQAGGVYQAGFLKATPALLFDHVQLAQRTFLRNRGGELRFDLPFRRRTNFFVAGRDVLQDYVATPDVPTAPERTGAQIDLTAGSDHLLGPVMKLGTLVGYTRKNARKSYWAFDRVVLGLNHAWLLGRGSFFLTNVLYNHDRYDQPDFAVSRKWRRDDTLRASGTLGAPLSLLHPKLGDLVATLTYEYYQACSTVKNYSYTNNKIAGMLTYRWEVGL